MNSMARRMFELVEPIGVIPYSADEPNEAMFALGFTNYWDIYFAVRAAPLGPAPAEVVDALFYNFAPGEVARHIPKVWRTTTPEAAIAARQRGCVKALRRILTELGEVVGAHFDRHPDAEIYASQPGLGVILSARVLAEFGDDPHRFADARARKNYAGTSPITRASGTRRVVLARYARNRRLADALQQWAFCCLRGSPGAKAYYQALRARGTGHQAALRQLSNRFVGILHGCLASRTLYNEHTAWDHQQQSAA